MRVLHALCIKIKLWMSMIYTMIDAKFQEQFGFYFKEITFGKTMKYLYSPKDSSSLAVTRILFGIAMLFDIPDERGGSLMEELWGGTVCNFPLIPFIKAIPMPYMALVYAGLWFGALGIALGYKYRRSAIMFTTCYWYLFLIEKSSWNNHSYLFGLVALLLTFTEANCYWSLDVYMDPSQSKETVPYWNYFILKYQFFILYFMAGMKKGTAEWLTGYSVQNLSQHWVFQPFKLFLTVAQTDYIIVHWFVFAFDLTIAVWMMWKKSRNIAMIFCALFHLMNSRLFSIGMFPWVCLATMPLFYPFDWPKTIAKCIKNLKNIIVKKLRKYLSKVVNVKLENETENEELSQQRANNNEPDDINNNNTEVENLNNLEDEPKGFRVKLTFILIILHVVTQAFLPYSHFITKGYNNWTKGLYGYSWDMMVHTWEMDSVAVLIVDNTKQEKFEIAPLMYSPNDRWTRHGDMVHQYASCLRDKITQNGLATANISIYVDIWCSLNGRFTQRMFDSKVDLLNVSWSVFEPVRYLMPLLDALEWRSLLHTIKGDVQSWNNNSRVIFIADFPGYSQDKHIPVDLSNISITILDGVVAYVPGFSDSLNSQSYQLKKDDHLTLTPGTSHKIINIGTAPAFYMYIYAIKTEAERLQTFPADPKLPITQELLRRIINMIKFAQIVVTNILNLIFEHCF